ncbi:MAG: hypothetical protein ABI411_20685, partial [Tahibacter sp.]
VVMVRMVAVLLGVGCLAWAASRGNATETESPAVQSLAMQVRAGQLDEAVAHGEALVLDAPADSRAWSWLGRAYGRQAQRASFLRRAGWASKCRDAFEHALGLDARRADAHLDMLQFYAMAPALLGGSRSKAHAQAREVAALDAVAGHVAEAQVAQFAENNAALAERELQQALALAPRDPLARTVLTQLLARQLRWKDAFAVWEPGVAGNPDEPLAHYAYGRIASQSGERLQDGLVQLDLFLAAKDKPDDVSDAAAHWRKGLILEKLGRPAAALVELQRATSMHAAPEEAKQDLARVEKLLRGSAG